MREVLNSLMPGAFEPEEIQVLVEAFEEAVRLVHASGAPFAEQKYEDRVRDILAASIIDDAKKGERDRSTLAQNALQRLISTRLGRRDW